MIPKLSSLTLTDKILIVAELDGWTKHALWKPQWPAWVQGVATDKIRFMASPDTSYRGDFHYTASYDAIIPLCFKYYGDWFFKAFTGSSTTPLQLLDALLIATGKAEV